MALPIAAILKTVTALGSAVGLYVARQKEEKSLLKNEGAGKMISDLQADLQKQTVFIASLTKEVEALTIQVQQQQAQCSRAKVLALIALGIAIVLAVSVIWMEIDR